MAVVNDASAQSLCPFDIAAGADDDSGGYDDREDEETSLSTSVGRVPTSSVSDVASRAAAAMTDGGATASGRRFDNKTQVAARCGATARAAVAQPLGCWTHRRARRSTLGASQRVWGRYFVLWVISRARVRRKNQKHDDIKNKIKEPQSHTHTPKKTCYIERNLAIVLFARLVLFLEKRARFDEKQGLESTFQTTKSSQNSGACPAREHVHSCACDAERRLVGEDGVLSTGKKRCSRLTVL